MDEGTRERTGKGNRWGMSAPHNTAGSNPAPSTNAEGRAVAIPASRLRIDDAWQEGEADWSESTGRA